MEEKGAREEVEVGEQRLGGIDLRTDAAAAAIIEHVEQRVHGVVGPPAMRGGVELPERADLGALPAAHRRLGLARRAGRGEPVEAGETADGGGIEMEAEAAQDFAGGKAIAGRRAAGEELAQERRDLCGPHRGMIAARGAWQPGTLAALRAGAQIIGVEFVEAITAQDEFHCCGHPAQLTLAKGGKDFTNERRSEAVDELLIVLFIAATMRPRSRRGEPATARLCSQRDIPEISRIGASPECHIKATFNWPIRRLRQLRHIRRVILTNSAFRGFDDTTITRACLLTKNACLQTTELRICAESARCICLNARVAGGKGHCRV